MPGASRLTRHGSPPWTSCRGLAAASTLGVISLVVPAVLSGPTFRRLADGELRRRGTRSAIDAQSSVHVVFAAQYGSSSKGIVADVGTHSGTEKFAYGGTHIQVRVTPSDAYVSGSASGLSTILGLTSSEAQKVGSRWVYWKSGTSRYSAVKADVTMPSVTGLLPRSQGYEAVDGHGKRALALRPQMDRGRHELDTTGREHPPAIGERADPADRGGLHCFGGLPPTTTLSDWGETIVVSAPPSASTISATKITG